MPLPDVGWGGRDTSALSHEQIHRWVHDGADPAALAAARDRHAAHGEELRAAAERLRRSHSAVEETWQGRDADAAGERVRALAARLTRTGDTVSAQARSLDGVRVALERVQAAVGPPRPAALPSLSGSPAATGLRAVLAGSGPDAFASVQAAHADEVAARGAYRAYLEETSDAARGAPAPGGAAAVAGGGVGDATGAHPASAAGTPAGTPTGGRPGVLARAASGGPGAGVTHLRGEESAGVADRGPAPPARPVAAPPANAPVPSAPSPASAPVPGAPSPGSAPASAGVAAPGAPSGPAGRPFPAPDAGILPGRGPTVPAPGPSGWTTTPPAPFGHAARAAGGSAGADPAGAGRPARAPETARSPGSARSRGLLGRLADAVRGGSGVADPGPARPRPAAPAPVRPARAVPPRHEDQDPGPAATAPGPASAPGGDVPGPAPALPPGPGRDRPAGARAAGWDRPGPPASPRRPEYLVEADPLGPGDSADPPRLVAPPVLGAEPPRPEPRP